MQGHRRGARHQSDIRSGQAEEPTTAVSGVEMRELVDLLLCSVADCDATISAAISRTRFCDITEELHVDGGPA